MMRNDLITRVTLYPLHDCPDLEVGNVNVVELTISVELTDERLAARCIHNVPVEKIRQMRERWER